MPQNITILLVEDNATISAAIRALLRTEPAFRTVGLAADGEEAVRLAGELRPDVVVMDVNLPGAFDGIEATRRIVGTASPTSKVVGLSASLVRVQDIIDAGAVRFLPKDRAVELVAVIKAVVAM